MTERAFTKPSDRKTGLRIRPCSSALRATPPCPPRTAAFTLIELLVVISIIGILASMLLPTLGRGKESAQRIACLNNLKQLAIAFTMYPADHESYYCPRGNGPDAPPPAIRWPGLLRPNYDNLKILRCPSDISPGLPATQTSSPNEADATPRSYFINGWNDFFREQMGSEFSMAAMSGKAPKDNDIRYPSETVVFGEKTNQSSHYYMDLEEVSRGNIVGNDYGEMEQGRHSGRKGSNFAFVDGSARFLKRWQSVGPDIHLWAVTSAGRTNYAFR